MNGCEFVVVAGVASSAVIVKCTVFLIKIYDAFVSGLDHLYRCVNLDCLICIKSSYFCYDRKEKGKKKRIFPRKIMHKLFNTSFSKTQSFCFFSNRIYILSFRYATDLMCMYKRLRFCMCLTCA